MPVDVNTTSRVDFGDLGGRLLTAERKVLTKYRDRTVNVIKGHWLGWLYKGRPASAPRGVSLDAWKAKVDTREGRGVLVVSNRARGYASRKAYVAYVHRSGQAGTQEWRVAWDATVAEIMPPLAVDLAAEIVKSLNKRRPPTRIRKVRPDVAVTTTGLVL